ncbi:MAG: serine recombinase [Chloroflexota bacterium]|nr:MAG: serine recombinase [Chloroflexota bacterium]
MTRAVTYARVSSDDRLNDGRNIILGQQKLCSQYIAQKGYLLIDEIPEDERGASGADRNLPGLQKILRMARASEFDVLVVREMDRLARGLVKQLLIEEELKTLGIRIEYVLGEYPDDPEGRLNKHIKAVIAEYEREKIAQRTQRGRRNKVKQGHVSVGGHAPYGYRIVKQQDKKGDFVALVIHEDEAAVVRFIFELYTRLVNPVSLRGIAAKLTEMRVPTYVDTGVRPRLTPKKNGYGHWNPRAVRSILRNPVYVGRWFYGKGKAFSTRQMLQPLTTWLEVQVPPLIDVEMFNSAQQRISENRLFASKSQKYDYLLARRITCQCGEKIHCIHNYDKIYNRDYFYYRCPVREDPKGRYASRKCTTPSFCCADVDRAAWGWLKQLISCPELIAEALEEFENQQSSLLTTLELQANTVRTNLEKAHRQLNRLIEVYVTSGSAESRLLLEQQQGELEESIAAMGVELQRLEQEIAVVSASAEREQTLALAGFMEQLEFAFDQSDEPFEIKKWIIDLLDVRGRLVIEEGKKVIYLTTIVTPENFRVLITER